MKVYLTDIQVAIKTLSSFDGFSIEEEFSLVYSQGSEIEKHCSGFSLLETKCLETVQVHNYPVNFHVDNENEKNCISCCLCFHLFILRRLPTSFNIYVDSMIILRGSIMFFVVL